MLHELAVMDHTGDTKTTWDPENETEVKNAKEQFKKWKDAGYAIFSVGKDGKKDEVLHKFDPDIDKMIATPAVRGG
jgi:hypothetical protein